MTELTHERLGEGLAARQEISDIEIHVRGENGLGVFNAINRGGSGTEMAMTSGIRPSRFPMFRQDATVERLTGKRAVRPGLTEEQEENAQAISRALPGTQFAVAFADDDLRDAEGKVRISGLKKYRFANLARLHVTDPLTQIVQRLSAVDRIRKSPITPTVAALFAARQTGLQPLLDNDPRLYGGLKSMLPEIRRVVDRLSQLRDTWHETSLNGEDTSGIINELETLITHSFVMDPETTEGLAVLAAGADKSGKMQQNLAPLTRALSTVLGNVENMIAESARLSEEPSEGQTLFGHIAVNGEHQDVLGTQALRNLTVAIEQCLEQPEIDTYLRRLPFIPRVPGNLTEDGNPAEGIDKHALYFMSSTRVLFNLLDKIEVAAVEALQAIPAEAPPHEHAAIKNALRFRTHMQKGVVCGLMINQLILLLNYEEQDTTAHTLAGDFLSLTPAEQAEFIEDPVKVNQLTTAMLHKLARISHLYPSIRAMITAIQALFGQEDQAVRHVHSQ